MKIILVDHDDSFTYNLQHWLKPICAEVQVINHQNLKKNLQANLIVLSPGPKSPQDYPHVKNFIKNLSKQTPVYGVCLGLQMLVDMDGGKITSYSPPLHGKKSKLNVTSNFYNSLHDSQVARYHSLYCSEFSAESFETLATSQDDKLPMWLKHREKKWMGVQFHPESFLTEKSALHLQILNSWLST